jgi:hypothetical protein
MERERRLFMSIFDFVKRKRAERKNLHDHAHGVPGARKPQSVRDAEDHEIAASFDVPAELKRAEESQCPQQCGPRYWRPEAEKPGKPD